MTAILFVDFCRGSVSVRRCSFVCEMRVGDDRERRWSEERHGYDVQIQRFALQKCIGVSKIRLKVKLIFLYRKSLLKKKKTVRFLYKKTRVQDVLCKKWNVFPKSFDRRGVVRNADYFLFSSFIPRGRYVPKCNVSFT